MFNGIISKQLASLQSEHLEGLHSKLSPYKWMAIFQQPIWRIVWLMWEDRNNTLHTTHSTTEELTYINLIINIELTRGLDGLPGDYTHLFQIQLDQLPQKDTSIKQQWISSVWSARELHQLTFTHTQHQNKFNTFFPQWRV